MQTYKRWQPYWMIESESQKILIVKGQMTESEMS